MSLARNLTDEEAYRPCSRCHLRPRGKGRNTWCTECKGEWQRGYRAGVKLQQRVSPPVQDENGCLIWQGYVDPNGYGRVTLLEESLYVHRVAWEAAHGPIPDELTVDHRCGVRSCANVEHMELVTRGENAKRGVTRTMERRGDTCINGHPFDRSSRRRCRECLRLSNARARARRAS